MSRFILSGALAMSAIFFLSVSCTKTGNSDDQVIVLKAGEGQALATVGDKILTLEELRADFLQRQGTFRGSAKLNSDKAREGYIEDRVIEEAMFQEALALDYFNKVDVKRDLKKMVVQRLMRDKLEEAQKNFAPTDEQIKEHYERNKNLYHREEAAKVAFISVKFTSDRARAKRIAQSIYDDAKKTLKHGNDRDLSRIAAQHSAKLTDAHGISIAKEATGYLDEKSFEQKFGSGSFASVKSIKMIGEIAPLLSTKDAFVVMMKTGYRKELNESIADAKEKITRRLSFENRGTFYKDFIGALRKKYDIKVFNELLASLSEDTDNDSVAKKDADE